MIRSTLVPAALAALLATASAAAAQSLTSVRGLGYPIVPADARTEVLGGLGIGLHGLSSSMVDPAAAAGLQRRGAVVSVTSVEQGITVGGASDNVGAARFPLIRLVYPVGGVVLTGGYGAYLDQAWAISRTGEQTVGAGTTLSYRDRIESRGGIGQLQLGVAAPLGQRFAVGGSIGFHMGSHTLQFQRLFDPGDFGSLEPFGHADSVSYSAPMAQLGARWDPTATVRIAGSVTWGGTLKVDPVSSTAIAAEYDLPLQVAGGASAYLAPGLLAAVSGRWSGWSSVGTVEPIGFVSLTPAAARDTWEVGGGLELDNPAARRTRSFPIRVGGHYRQLPFTFGGEAPTEWFVGAGAGMRIGSDIENPIARLDLTVQRGERTAAGDMTTPALTETMWRLSLGLSIFGT